MASSIGLLLAAMLLQSPAADSLRQLSLTAAESELVVQVRARPLPSREALAEALRRSVRATGSARDEVESASRLAAAYAIAWSDSFFVLEVKRFTAWTREQRTAKVWADSMRRAGVAAFSRDGSRAAIALWRRALVRSWALADTSGAAAILGNIGAAHLDMQSVDSAAVQCGQARRLATAVGDLRVQTNAVVCLAEVSAERGDLATARARHEQALALHERIGDSRGMAADHNNLGLLAQSVGDLREARRRFEAALALHAADGRDDLAATNLVNLAGLATIEGDFRRAETQYRDALATWRALGQWAEATDALRGLGQLEQRRGDYPAARAAFLESVRILERSGADADALTVRRELAMTLAAMGDLQGALDQLRRTQLIADSIGAPVDVRAGITIAHADLAFLLNAHAEASRRYSEAERLYRRAGDREGEAQARHGRALLLLERDDAAGAEALLRTALRAQTAAADHRSAALTRSSLGRVLRERGDTAESRRQLSRASSDLIRLGDHVGAAAALDERAALAASSGLLAAADSLYRAGLAQLAGRPAPEVAWRLHAGLGGVRRAQGQLDAAARELREALVEIERPGRSLTLAERRSAFLADKWDVYASLALVEHERQRSAAAFEASERLRAREMLELLSRGRVTSSPDAPAPLADREQDLRRQIAELTRSERGGRSPVGLRGPLPSPTSGPALEALRAARTAYADLLVEMRDRGARHVDLVAAREPVGWRDVSVRLARDEALLEYLVSDSGSLAFVITRDTLVVVDLGIRRRELARLVEFSRGTLDRAPTGSDEALWRSGLRRLHEQLITPIEETSSLVRKTQLIIVPHVELHYVPFGALLGSGESGQFLVQRFDIAVTPSASAWIALAERARPAADGLLAMAPNPEALRGSQREVAAIARLRGPDAHVLSGAAATEEAFRRDAPGRRILHLATYGFLNRENPFFSYLDLAASDRHDGRLDVHEIYGLSLAADLVVLSACQTGLASGALTDVPAGDDWVGLTRAFLHAGATSVAATLWAVEDWATASLIERFYEEYQREPEPVRAMSRAQRAMLAAPATAHPFYWAAFVVVRGHGRSRQSTEREAR